MVKKKLLFVTLYLHTGGVEKSLLALLSELDYKKYDVDLLLFDHSGLLFEMVPKQVNILPPLFRCFSSPLSKAVPQLMKERRFRLLAGKALASAAGKFSKGKGIGFRWTIYRLSVGEIDKCYDVAISYFDFFCNYYVAEKVKGKLCTIIKTMPLAYNKDGDPQDLNENVFQKVTILLRFPNQQGNPSHTTFQSFCIR
jgi:hypothetical protein